MSLTGCTVRVRRERGLNWDVPTIIEAIETDLRHERDVAAARRGGDRGAADGSSPSAQSTAPAEDDAAQEEVRSQVTAYRNFAEAMSFVVGTYYLKVGQKLRAAFLPPTAAAAAEAAGPTSPGGKHNNPMQERVIALGADIAELLNDAEYRPLSAQQYALALETNFNFAMPNGTKWSELDGVTLPDVYRRLAAKDSAFFRKQGGLASEGDDSKNATAAQHEYVPGSDDDDGANAMPEFAKHLLIAVRGFHVEHKTDFFFRRKIDLIVIYLWNLLASLVAFAVGTVRGHAAGERAARRWNALMTAGAEATPLANLDPSQRGGAPRNTAATKKKFDNDEPTADGSDDVVPLERRTIDEAVRESGLFLGFFKLVTATEPCFDSVVVLYRNAPPAAANIAAAAAAAAAAKIPPIPSIPEVGLGGDGAAAASGKVRSALPATRTNDTASTAPSQQALPGPEPWQLEAYHDVPFGDLEMVLPHKKLGMLPVDTVKTAIGVIGLVVALYYAIYDARHGNVDPTGFVCQLADKAEASPNSTILAAAYDVVDYVQAEISFGARLLIGLTVVVTIGTQLATVIFNYISVITLYRSMIQAWLLAKRVARGRDVVAKLIDEVATQDVAEIVLGKYALEAVLGAPDRSSDEDVAVSGVTIAQIRARAEAAIRRLLATGGSANRAADDAAWEAIEFDAADSLWKLISLNLAERSTIAEHRFTRGADVTKWFKQSGLAKASELQLRDPTLRHPAFKNDDMPRPTTNNSMVHVHAEG